MYKGFLEDGALIRYILHDSGYIQRTIIWFENGHRKSDSMIIAVDGNEKDFDMIVEAAEIRRKEFEKKYPRKKEEE